MFDKKVFGERLSSLRNSRSLSQQAIADILGVGKSAISMMESGNRAASADVLIALADYFDVPLDYMTVRGIFAEWDKVLENWDIIIDVMRKVPEPFGSILKKCIDTIPDRIALGEIFSALIKEIRFGPEPNTINFFWKF